MSQQNASTFRLKMTSLFQLLVRFSNKYMRRVQVKMQEKTVFINIYFIPLYA